MAPDSGTCCAMRELHVAGARRHVDDEHVELAPGHVAQHLRQRRDHHRPAPDDRRALVDQEAHRHGLEAVGFHGPQAVAVGHLRPAGEAEQARLRGAVDVGVEDAGLEADGLEAERQVDGRGRFADAALAGGDGDHVLDAGGTCCIWPRPPPGAGGAVAGPGGWRRASAAARAPVARRAALRTPGRVRAAPLPAALSGPACRRSSTASTL